MNKVDTQGKSFEEIANEMDSNGYAHFDPKNYKAKNNLPCFIPENSEDLYDIESYQSMHHKVMDALHTKEFLAELAYSYGDIGLANVIENSSEIDKLGTYIICRAITKESPSEFAKNFLDNYFYGGDDVWCSIDTKIADFLNGC